MPDGDVLDCLDLLRDLCPQTTAGMGVKTGTMVIEQIPRIILAIPNPLAGSELPIGAALPIWIFGAGGDGAGGAGCGGGGGLTPRMFPEYCTERPCRGGTAHWWWLVG